MKSTMPANVAHSYYVTAACLKRSLDAVNGALVSHHLRNSRKLSAYFL
jgi:hypothetical protein